METQIIVLLLLFKTTSHVFNTITCLFVSIFLLVIKLFTADLFDSILKYWYHLLSLRMFSKCAAKLIIKLACNLITSTGINDLQIGVACKHGL